MRNRGEATVGSDMMEQHCCCDVVLALLLIALSGLGCGSQREGKNTLHEYSDQNWNLDGGADWSTDVRQAFHVRHGWKLISSLDDGATVTEWAWTVTVSLDSISGSTKGATEIGHSNGSVTHGVDIDALRYTLEDGDGFVLSEDALEDSSFPVAWGRYSTAKSPITLHEGETRTYRQMATLPRSRAGSATDGRCHVHVPLSPLHSYQEVKGRLDRLDDVKRESMAWGRIAARGAIYDPVERKRAFDREIRLILEEERRADEAAAPRR
jgi:hypothetical protein